MRRKFTDYGKALAAGREFFNRTGVRVYIVSVYGGPSRPGVEPFHWLFSSAGNGGEFWTGWIGADYGPGGWYFGGARGTPSDAYETLAALPELPELPGKQEFWYATVAAHTAGWSHEQKLLLARRCDASNAGVWHESHRLHKELNPTSPVECPCGPCTDKRKETK